MVKIFVLIFFLFFPSSASTKAEVVTVPPVREAPGNETQENQNLEKILGSCSNGDWQSPPPKRIKAPKTYPAPNANYRPSCPAQAPPPVTSLYGDPTRGFVHNRSNFFIRGYWASQNGNGKPGSQPAFELAPGFIWEGNIRPGGYKWLYVEAVAATGAGAARVGWKTFEIYPYNQPLIYGWYGWQVYVNSGDFPYFTGPIPANQSIP